jgi:murein DD-endopeptidase MepM/ murein hydrolase activator NlpD
MIVKIGTVTAGYGVISPVHPTPHTGIDFWAPRFTQLYAPYDGYISSIRDYGGKSLGKAIFVTKSDGTQYCLGHLSRFADIKVGQVVEKGQTLLGYVGSSGRSTGPHLHYAEFIANGMPTDPGGITFAAFQHHPVADWIHNFTVNAINEMVTDITINVLANPQFLTILILAFSIYYMVSSLKWAKWLILFSLIYLIIAII